MIIEHILYTDRQASKLNPVTDTPLPYMKAFRFLIQNNFQHQIFLTLDENWPYRFMIETIILGHESDYKVNTWFMRLTDLLEFIATHLSTNLE
jgi:hypothetical protein